jgi:hypothetical protein
VKDDSEIIQCKCNILAILEHYQLGPIDVLTTQSDRITAYVREQVLGRLSYLVEIGKFNCWKFNRNHGATAINGWRELSHRCSMQIIEHDTGVWEFDVDLYNPDYGVMPAMQHLLLEVWKPGKTDPFTVAKGLKKRGIL